MAKIKPILYTYRKNKDGSYPIYISIADSEKTLYHSLRVSIFKTKWSESKSRVLGDGSEAAKVNKLISDKLSECDSIVLNLRLKGIKPTANRIKAKLNIDVGSGGDRDFIKYALKYAEEVEKKGRIGSSKKLKSTIKKFSQFCSGKVAFEDITPTLLRNFETYLTVEKRNSSTTIASNFKTIRSVYKRAHEEDLFELKKDPFAKIKLRENPPSRERLTVDEIERIQRLEYKRDSLHFLAQKTFLFSFYCAGIRFSDICMLKWDSYSGDYLSYQMTKTGKQKKVFLIDQAKEIIRELDYRRSKEFVFKLLNPKKNLDDPKTLHNQISSKNALINKYLKKIARDAEIEKRLSFHVARHSFADIARVKGWDLYNISKALGHSTLNITEKYLNEFDQDSLDEQMKENFI